eukprot:9396133-Heterocapsa_arctica.AAC.1
MGFEMRTENMDRILFHSKVTTHRTCVKEANPSPYNLGQPCGDKLHCITCAAILMAANYMQDTYGVTNSSIVDEWVSLKTEPDFQNMHRDQDRQNGGNH